MKEEEEKKKKEKVTARYVSRRIERGKEQSKEEVKKDLNKIIEKNKSKEKNEEIKKESKTFISRFRIRKNTEDNIKPVKIEKDEISESNNNYYFDRRKKNNSSSRGTVIHQIPISTERKRHFTNKVDNTNKIVIEKEKTYRTIENKVEANYSKVYNEGTFKNSIRNKYKMKNLENKNK